MIGLLANWRVLGAAAALAALAAAWWYVDSRAYQRGHSAATSAWQAREVAELQAANAEILRLQAAAAAKERAAAEAIAAVDKRYQQELANVQAQRKRFLADVTSGRVRYYLPAARQGAGSGPGAAPAAPAGGGPDPARAYLPEQVQRLIAGAGDLLGEADEVTVQLRLAQGTIEGYLKACGAAP